MHDIVDAFHLHIAEANDLARKLMGPLGLAAEQVRLLTDNPIRLVQYIPCDEPVGLHKFGERDLVQYSLGANSILRAEDAVAHQRACALDLAREQVTFSDNPVRAYMDQMRHDETLWRAKLLNPGLTNGLGCLRADELARRHQPMFDATILDQVRESARLAQALALPTVIEPFRTPIEAFADKLLHLESLEWVREPSYLAAFNETSAIADLLAQNRRVDSELREAAGAFATSPIPSFETLAGYRHFLDAAGLALGRWPCVRLLTYAEKRRRLKTRLKQNAEPTHVKQAKSLVHRYELTLRGILDGIMAATYGEDWAEQRLPLCDCKDLLGKWKKRGGAVLDNADYPHYACIMSHAEHFEAAFNCGFDDPQMLTELITRAGRLRAASHHGRTFTLEDLRDLRLVWREIERGLIALTPDYELEPWG